MNLRASRPSEPYDSSEVVSFDWGQSLVGFPSEIAGHFSND